MDPVTDLKDDPIAFERETVLIEGGRRLYLYTFCETDADGPTAPGEDPS